MNGVRLVMTWNFRDDMEGACMAYMVNTLGPGLHVLGYRVHDAWYTLIGSGPQIIAVGAMPTAEAAHRMLASPDFRRLLDGLLEYAEDFSYHITPWTGGFIV